MRPGPEFRRYLLWQLPGWLVAAAAGAVLAGGLGWPGWAAALLPAAWILKDLLLYPAMREAFRPAPPPLVGRRGQAVERLAPDGWVRVSGELWRARVAGPGAVIESGRGVVVRGARGLTLIVEEAA